MLSFGSRRCRRRPYAGKILRKCQDLVAIYLVERELLTMAPALVLALKLLDCANFVFPLRFERSRYQAVLWFDDIVLPSSSLGVVARSLQP